MSKLSIYDSALVVLGFLIIVFSIHSYRDYVNTSIPMFNKGDCVAMDILDVKNIIFTISENNDKRHISFGILKIKREEYISYEMIGIPYKRLRELDPKKVQCEEAFN